MITMYLSFSKKSLYTFRLNRSPWRVDDTETVRYGEVELVQLSKCCASVKTRSDVTLHAAHRRRRIRASQRCPQVKVVLVSLNEHCQPGTALHHRFVLSKAWTVSIFVLKTFTKGCLNRHSFYD